MADSAMASPLTSEAVQPLRDRVRGRVLGAADEGYDEARMVHNGIFDRRPLGIVKAEQVGDVIACRELRARERAGSLGARRRAQRTRIRDERWGLGHRHVGDAHRARGSEKQDCSCRFRSDMGRLQLRNTRVRSGDDRRDHLDHGHLRSHPGRRHRLPVPRARAHDRQSHLSRRGHRGREVPHRERRRERGSLLGTAGWGWELRRGDVVRVSPRRGRAGLRRSDSSTTSKTPPPCSECSTSSSGKRPRSLAVSPGSRSPRRCPSSRRIGTATRCAWWWCTGPERSTKPRKS